MVLLIGAALVVLYVGFYPLWEIVFGVVLRPMAAILITTTFTIKI
jgi:hypothetical protein